MRRGHRKFKRRESSSFAVLCSCLRGRDELDKITGNVEKGGVGLHVLKEPCGATSSWQSIKEEACLEHGPEGSTALKGVFRNGTRHSAYTSDAPHSLT